MGVFIDPDSTETMICCAEIKEIKEVTEVFKNYSRDELK